VYQPILELKTLKCIKAEALIRWHHPQKGLINPDEFIGIAEETGMIHSLGKWILNQSIKDMVKLRQRLVAKTQMPMICINISPKQFAQPLNLDDFVFELKNNWLSPKDVCFEITEGLLLDASKTVIQAISRLKNEGIKFAIDDFGTGYSALAYLKKFDIDYLKIDKSFIGNLDSNINNRVLCESIISMSHKLKITVIAEGVEYPVQEEILRKNHCDYIQGYLHGKPMALDALIDEYLNNVVVVCDFVKRSKNKKDD
jgi:EAL domain-containing protein (putative c-di-GMP-specific phosphodiesterase class I)